MANRPTHPNKESEAAVAYAEEQGWSWIKVKGHAWGKLLCSRHDREGCMIFVWSTPRNPQNHSKHLRREIDRCPHTEPRRTMKTFEFSIIASGLDPQANDFADLFFDAGCDDATVAFQKGHIILDFSREAGSVDEAISSAVQCVENAGAHIDRIEPDPLVSLTDIAARAGLTRAAISNYAKGERSAGFPSPVARVTSKTSLYEWSDVATWLFRNKQLSKDAAIEAEAVRVANTAIQSGEPKLQEKLRAGLKAYERKLEAA